ncbi:MAG: hypothetical protein IPL61_18655 [Myxococcales bacterium]|nr:hypothetical protein [Myxococcales bacterium]
MSRAALIALVLAVAPTAALGFSEPERYAEPAIDGGGGGRYFTGAPPDGLSCSVCHGGGDTPEVKIAGLPDRIDAGKRYEATLTWPDDGRPYALTPSDRRRRRTRPSSSGTRRPDARRCAATATRPGRARPTRSIRHPPGHRRATAAPTR